MLNIVIYICAVDPEGMILLLTIYIADPFVFKEPIFSILTDF